MISICYHNFNYIITIWILPAIRAFGALFSIVARCIVQLHHTVVAVELSAAVELHHVKLCRGPTTDRATRHDSKP